MIALYVLLGLIVLTVIYGVSVYNKLVRLKTLMEEGWSAVEVFLKKRYDLIGNLVETVKGYALHEKETLENVILARSQAMNAQNRAEKSECEGFLAGQLGRLLAVSENYPQLRANENFMHLQQELSSLESEIETARRYYNGTVRGNNIAILSFPTNIIAGMFNFEEGVFFQIEKNEMEVPKVSFTK
jgi:Uncharacterized conserved protein